MLHQPISYGTKYEVLYENLGAIDKINFTVVLNDYITHNYLHKSIHSALNQTYPKKYYELLLLTDNKTIDCEKFSIDPELNVRVIFTGLISIGESLKLSLLLSYGKILCPLDNDDSWKNERLSELDGIFRDGKVNFVKNDIVPIDINGRNLSLRFLLAMNVRMMDSGKIFEIGDQMPSNIKGRPLMHNSSSMSIRKSVLEQSEYDFSNLETLTDPFLLFASLLHGGKSIYFDKKLTFYTGRPDSLSARQRIASVEKESRVIRQLKEFETNLFPLLCKKGGTLIRDLMFELSLVIKASSYNCNGAPFDWFRDIPKAFLLSIRHQKHNLLFLIAKTTFSNLRCFMKHKTGDKT